MEKVKPVKIEDEMRSSYLDYAMSVIVSRALPDVRDGLKPVHRRILYAMSEMGMRHDGPYKKSARIVGEVLGKYHPHGDTAVYDAMVRMAQDFSMRYPLIDGQGNFGSVDNDPPAAMRYTEARLAQIAEEMLVDIEKETVNFLPNFDDTLHEPAVLPARLPNLLLNGASGIAVGMATNIPPHNLAEVCDAIIHLLENPGASPEDFLRLLPGPDFPTGGIILGRDGINAAYATGHGRILLRAKAHIEEVPRSGRHQIVVTELPYQVNKAALVEKIAELVKARKIEAISDIRDESDREGMRIVLELKREAQPRQVLNSLYKHTPMQSAFFVNMLALVAGEPKVLPLKKTLEHYLNHRREVVMRRSRFELERARERAHLLEGLKVALDHLDKVIALIRGSQNADTARKNLMQTFHLSEAQAQAILDTPLRRLAALERKKLLDEYTELLKTIARLEHLLASPKQVDYVIREEVLALKDNYSDPRRTLISTDETGEIREEDLVPDQEVMVTLSQRGYLKRVPQDAYRIQRRGGRGITGMVMREADAVRHLLCANTHDTILFFTNRGRVFPLHCHEIPDASRQARGIPLVNLLSVERGEVVTALVALPGLHDGECFFLGTRLGEVKRIPLHELATVRSSGLIAMDLAAGDELCSVCLTSGEDQLVLVTEAGKAIRFSEKGVRLSTRHSGGVRGLSLLESDRVAAIDVVLPEAALLVVTEKGFGKRTPLSEYPTQGRGGEGVRALGVNEKTGRVVAAQVVMPSQEVMLVSAEGIVLRTQVDSIPSMGRAAQGVHLMKLDRGDRVVSIAALAGLDAGQRRELILKQKEDALMAGKGKSKKGAKGSKGGGKKKK